MGVTSYLGKKMVDHVLTKAVYTPAASIWISAHTGDPTRTGSHSNEISTSGTGYARQNITSNMTVADAVTSISSNSSVIIVGPATADWGTLNYGAFEDAVSASNMLFSGALTTAQTINNGANFELVPTQAQLQFQ